MSFSHEVRCEPCEQLQTYTAAKIVPASLSRSSIAESLDKLLHSETFAAAPLLRRFLEFLVSSALLDAPSRFKEYSIGIEVFGRDDSFDPRVDPIVRVEARRLRAKLAAYYNTEGLNDLVKIEIPKGHYAPSFVTSQPPLRASSSAVRASRSELRAPSQSADKGVAVIPFLSLSSDVPFEMFADGLADRLISILSENGQLSVVPLVSVLHLRGKGAHVKRLGRLLGVRLIVEGSVQKDGKALRIGFRLIDAACGYTVLSRCYDRELGNTFGIQEEVSHVIAGVIKTRLSSISHTQELANTTD